jgi:hypothetical protein
MKIIKPISTKTGIKPKHKLKYFSNLVSSLFAKKCQIKKQLHTRVIHPNKSKKSLVRKHKISERV